jgi:hypothetical protein
MHNLGDPAKITRDEKLRVAARDHLQGRANAARWARNRDNSAWRLEDLRVLRGRRAAQGC